MTYIDHLLILISGCISISAFSFIVGIPKGFMRLFIGLKICVRTTGIKKYQSVIKKKKKNYDKILSLAKPKLNRVEVLTSKALIDSNISLDKFALILSKEFDNINV